VAQAAHALAVVAVQVVIALQPLLVFHWRLTTQLKLAQVVQPYLHQVAAL
jgi:hypothetical protein